MQNPLGINPPLTQNERQKRKLNVNDDTTEDIQGNGKEEDAENTLHQCGRITVAAIEIWVHS